MVTRAAIITGGVVVNVTLADAELATEQGWVITDEADIGDLWDGKAFTKPPAPEPEAQRVPGRVEMVQARLALLRAGVTEEAVEALLDKLPSPQREAALIEWRFRSHVRRDSDLVAQLGPALGLTDAQIDELFILAAGL